MTAAVFGSSSRANAAYERIRLAGQQRPVPTAKMRTREVGFHLGSFELTYMAKDLEMGLAQELNHSLQNHPNLKKSLAAQAAKSVFSPSTTEPDTTIMARRRGVSAYHAQSHQADAETIPTKTLLSII